MRDGPGGRADRISWAERHLQWLYWVCAAGLTPWVAFLFVTQVRRAEAHQIGPLAGGLILAVMAGILLTAWTYPRGSPVPALLAVVAIVTIIGLCVLVIRRDFSGRPAAPARWLPIVLAAAALALIPTLVVVLTVLPEAQTAHHLKLAWTGLDVFEVAALAATGFALQRRSAMTAVPATITGALLVCDAWINIVPAHGAAFYEAIAMAFVELPLAGLSFWVATRHPGPNSRRSAGLYVDGGLPIR